VLGGLGARGLLFAPLLAEQLAAEICGEPTPLPVEIAALVSARRFEKS
jgi:tRNA 5-methylaminomethyl-2-thiouridine biosynthesis bifunctional protein